MQLNNTYDYHGIIESIPTDNGTEFKNGSVISALSPFGTRIEWCDAKAPEQKAQVERFFGTAMNRKNTNTRSELNAA